MAGEIAESEFKRESAELMRRLRLGSGYLLKDGRTGGWSLWSRKNALSAPVGKVADPLVCEMQRRDLLKSRPGGGLMLAQETAPLQARSRSRIGADGSPRSKRTKPNARSIGCAGARITPASRC
jgi:hypothetical protein